jgi:uncharacterized surface protein with fasciclin (FAS1) repeats
MRKRLSRLPAFAGALLAGSAALSLSGGVMPSYNLEPERHGSEIPGADEIIDVRPLTTLDYLEESGEFDRFIELVGRAGLGFYLYGDTPYTVFVPLDSVGYRFLPEGSVEEFVVRPDITVQSLVEFHFVEGILPMDEMETKLYMTPSLRTTDIRIRADHITVHDARIVRGNIRTANGMIHVIDRLQLP